MIYAENTVQPRFIVWLTRYTQALHAYLRGVHRRLFAVEPNENRVICGCAVIGYVQTFNKATTPWVMVDTTVRVLYEGDTQPGETIMQDRLATYPKMLTKPLICIYCF